jgi:putative MATE family efflux protein
MPGFFLGSALRGAGDMKTPMYAGLITGVLSLYLDYELILGKFGMPRLEVIGAALAINIAWSVNGLILFFLIITNRTPLKFSKDGWKPKDDLGKSIMKIGIPSAMEWILIQIGVLVYVSVITYYGADALAAYFTGMSVLALAQTASAGFQTAATTLVGKSVGARNFSQAENIFRHAGILGFVSMFILGLLVYFGMTPMVLQVIFNKLNPSSIHYSRMYIMLLVFAMPLMGFYFSIAGGLRGAGDTIWPLISSTTGVYGGRILLAMGLYHLFHPPIYIIWGSMFADQVIRGFIVTLRLHRGKWKISKV